VDKEFTDSPVTTKQGNHIYFQQSMFIEIVKEGEKL